MDMKNTEATQRVKCPKGHWVSVQLILKTDLRTQVIRPGQRCPMCRTIIATEEN